MNAVAYHEAGHAVAALRLCHCWSFLSLEGGGGTFEPQRPGLLIEFREAAIRAAAVFCAGPAAQTMFSGEPVPIVFTDLAGLDELARRFPDPRFRTLAKRLARCTIRRHWRDVERVALALAERRYLAPMDLAGIVERKAS